MRTAKLVTGIFLGSLLAVCAVWIGVGSLDQFSAPQQAFALLAAVPRTLAPVQELKKKVVPVPVKKAPTTPAPVFASVPVPTPVVPPTTPAAIELVPTPAPVPPAPIVAPTPVLPVATTQPIISEVFVGSEASGEDEFVELYNPGEQPVDLTGYAVKKKTSSGSESTLVATTRLQGKVIAPRGYFLLVHDGSTISGADVFWAKSNTLAAKNNAIGLYDSSGVLIDQVSWAEIPKGSSYARVPLMSGGSFSIQSVPTGGAR